MQAQNITGEDGAQANFTSGAPHRYPGYPPVHPDIARATLLDRQNHQQHRQLPQHDGALLAASLSHPLVAPTQPSFINTIGVQVPMPANAALQDTYYNTTVQQQVAAPAARPVKLYRYATSPSEQRQAAAQSPSFEVEASHSNTQGSDSRFSPADFPDEQEQQVRWTGHVARSCAAALQPSTTSEDEFRLPLSAADPDQPLGNLQAAAALNTTLKRHATRTRASPDHDQPPVAEAPGNAASRLRLRSSALEAELLCLRSEAAGMQAMVRLPPNYSCKHQILFICSHSHCFLASFSECPALTACALP